MILISADVVHMVSARLYVASCLIRGRRVVLVKDGGKWVPFSRVFAEGN